MKARNDERLATLHGLDHVYMETLVGYLRSDFTRQPEAVEDVIADVLDGVTTAPTAGESAAGHFGDDPQAAADAILAELPRRTPAQYFALVWPWVNLVAAFLFLQGLFRQPMIWQIADLDALIIAPALVAGPWFFRGIDFNRWSARTKRSMVIGIVIFGGIVGGGAFLMGRLGDIQIARFWLLLAVAVLFAGSLLNMYCERAADWWVLTWVVLALTIWLSNRAFSSLGWWGLALANFALMALAFRQNLVRRQEGLGG